MTSCALRSSYKLAAPTLFLCIGVSTISRNPTTTAEFKKAVESKAPVETEEKGRKSFSDQLAKRPEKDNLVPFSKGPLLFCLVINPADWKVFEVFDKFIASS